MREISRRHLARTGRRSRQQNSFGPLRVALLASSAFLLAAAVFLVAVPSVAAFGVYTYFMASLPGLVEKSHQATFQTTKIFDRNGKLLYEVYDPNAGRRTVVPISEIPKTLIAATIATEDANFYSNPGFDAGAILRAAYQNFTGHRIVSGGSTITQQLIKNVFLTPEPTLKRKIQEVALAYALSKQYTKDQVLELYLNEIYYGNLAYGVEAAAESYFGKHAKDLDMAESAMLAGLPQSPSEYDPIQHREVAKRRQAEVLALMARDGYITRTQAAEAAREELHFKPQRTDIRAPHFVMYVREFLEKKYGAKTLYEGGLNVTTTLDLDLQDRAQQIVARHVASLKNKNVSNGALVAMRPDTGEVLAMVGSVDYYNDAIDGKFNVAIGLRQPGSAIKPFVYLTALAKGYTSVTPIDDVKVGNEFPNGDGTYYRPENYDRKYHGRQTVRSALGNSLNIPAVKVLKFVGIHSTLETVRNAGITTFNDEQRYGLALVLGGAEVKLLDLTSAYEVLANGGKRACVKVRGDCDASANPILRIEDGSGKVLEELGSPRTVQALSPQLSYIITSILSDDQARAMEFGAHSVLELANRPAAVKTGTTNDFRDNWTVGYTPQLVTGVWVGNSNNSQMKDIIGIDGAGPIWHDFMLMALADKPPEPFPVPDGLVKQTHYRAGGSYTEYFVKNTEPRNRSGFISGTPSPTASVSPVPGDTPAAVASGTPQAAGTSVPDSGQQLAGTPLPAVTPNFTPAPQPAAAQPPAPQPPPPPAPSPPSSGFQPPIVNRLVIPNVVGMPEAQAQYVLQQAGFSTARPNYQNFTFVPPGSVLSQTPPAGSVAERWSTVYIAVRKA